MILIAISSISPRQFKKAVDPRALDRVGPGTYSKFVSTYSDLMETILTLLILKGKDVMFL